MLDFERLHVYQCALSFAEQALGIVERLPRGEGELSDQLRRATLSIPLNIAEATGQTGQRERARYYAIARGSAMECGAIIDMLRLQRHLAPESADEAKALLVRMVSMLTTMCR